MDLGMNEDNNEDNMDLAMMRQPDEWPHGFMLPLTRREQPGTGYLFQPLMKTPCPPPEPVVWLGNIFDGHKLTNEKIRYDSLQAVILDGWTVD